MAIFCHDSDSPCPLRGIPLINEGDEGVCITNRQTTIYKRETHPVGIRMGHLLGYGSFTVVLPSR